jgi:hypothetical protein
MPSSFFKRLVKDYEILTFVNGNTGTKVFYGSLSIVGVRKS